MLDNNIVISIFVLLQILLKLGVAIYPALDYHLEDEEPLMSEELENVFTYMTQTQEGKLLRLFEMRLYILMSSLKVF